MFIEARLVVDVRPEAVVVPEDAIMPVQGSDYVWAVTEDGTVTRKTVTLGVRRPGYVEIREGLEPDTQVVVGGLERLSEGMPVIPNPVER
jgi:membrane fusion protein (multidrug efflux system)